MLIAVAGVFLLVYPVIVPARFQELGASILIAAVMFYEWCTISRNAAAVRNQLIAAALLAVVLLAMLLGYSAVGILVLLAVSVLASLLDSRLAVTILAPGGAHAWEGRAEASPRARSKDAEMRPLANEMATRLFSGFPGESGATIGAR